MATTRITEVLQRIEGMVWDYHARGQHRLPTRAGIVATLALPDHAVRRVLRTLEQGGILRMSRRSGIWLEPAGLTPDAFERARALLGAATAQAWERVSERLIEDIRVGILTPGQPLPPYKSLCMRFDANYRTVRRALADLEEKQLIERHRRGFRVRRADPRRSSGTIVFIAQARGPLTLANHTVNAPTFWETFEQECVRLNLRSEAFGYDRGGNLRRWQDPAVYTVADIMRRYPVLGFMVWAHNMKRGRFTELMSELRATGKPVSVLQESRALTPDAMAPLCGSSSRAAIFPLAVDRHPGEAVARFLCDKGHRSVALFSFHHPVHANRAAGIRELFRAVGARLHEYWIDFPDRYRKLLHDEYAPDNAPYVKADREIGALDEKLGQWFQEYTHTERSFIEKALIREFAFTRLRPCFEQARADSSITAWVGSNDIAALAALRFLHERAVDIPGEISVIGFDNLHESFARSLSSFDFNSRAATLAMVKHIVDPPAGRGGPARIHYTPGFVVERASTRAVRPSE